MVAVPSAIIDACVLYSAPVRDLVVRLAQAGLLQARWSGEIHQGSRVSADNTPEGSAVPSKATGAALVEDCPSGRSSATRERQSPAQVSRAKAHHVYEGSTVVRRAAWRGMLKESVCRTEEACLTRVPCIKGEYAPRISELLCVE
jgi:hypothetical protein